ncbi:MAG: transposase [Syntrophorhabdaceae bacterium]|nr:transposase [Syntrophorhabdaceae bacterium]
MLVKIQFNGTSQICSGCGEKVPKSLSVRTHRCPSCGLILDRGENAALNIKTLGQRVQDALCCLRILSPSGGGSVIL